MLITPMKSAPCAPCAPNWSFANSQGRWFNGAGKRVAPVLVFALRAGLISRRWCSPDSAVASPPASSAAGRLTLRLTASLLPLSHSRVRLEPPAADSTWLLPGLRHRDVPSWSPRAGRGSVQNAWVTFGEYGWVSLGKRRRPPLGRPFRGSPAHPATLSGRGSIRTAEKSGSYSRL